MSYENFLDKIRPYVVFKEHPKDTEGKDLDIFMSTADGLWFGEAMTEFEYSRIFFKKDFREGFKWRIVTYDEAHFKLLDLQVGGYYQRNKIAMTFEQILKNSKNLKGYRILKNDKTTKDWNFLFLFEWLFGIIRRTFSNEGSIIAIIGPDGSGKTTISNELNKRLSCAFQTERRYFGWGNFTPFMKTVYKAYNPPKGSSTSWTRLAAYYAELLLRYGRLWIKRTFLGRVVILDRYFYDKLALLPGNSLKSRIFTLITPKPDYVFLLKARPEKILERKKEIDDKMIVDIYDSLERFQATTIDANKETDEVIKQILDNMAEDLINKKVVVE